MIIRPPHLAYLPDMAPSDFYLFGYLEEKLEGTLFTDMDDLQEALNEILSLITHQQRKTVFEHWIVRCNWIVEQNRDYFHK